MTTPGHHAHDTFSPPVRRCDILIGVNAVKHRSMSWDPAVLLKVLIATFAIVLVPVALGGCNTIEGAGEDISAGGEAIDDAAD